MFISSTWKLQEKRIKVFQTEKDVDYLYVYNEPLV